MSLIRNRLFFVVGFFLRGVGGAFPEASASAEPVVTMQVRFDAEAGTLSGRIAYEGLPSQWENSLEIFSPDWDDLHATESARLSAFTSRISGSEDAHAFRDSGVPRVRLAEVVKAPHGLSLTFETRMDAGGGQGADGQWVLAAWYPELREKGTRRSLKGRWQLLWTSDVKVAPVLTLPRTDCPAAVTAGHCFASPRAGSANGILDDEAQAVERDLGNGKKLVGVFRHKEFNALFDSLAVAVPWLTESLGALPLDNLLVVEGIAPMATTHPGLVPVQIPAQAGVRALFTRESEWTRWQTLENLVSQWWGGVVPFPGAEAITLREGLASFSTLQLLDGPLAAHHRFLSGRLGDLTGIEWNFLEHTLSFLAIVHRRQGSWLSAESSRSAFSRVSLALRQTAKTFGERALQQALAGLWKKRNGIPIRTRQEFLKLLLEELEALPEPVAIDGVTARDLLQGWLLTEGWWDPALKKVDTEGRTLVVDVEQKGELRLPVLVRASWEGAVLEGWTLSRIRFPCPPSAEGCGDVRVELDPERFGFDGNRFNNSNEFHFPRFFPGNARTLADDALTFVWVPFALRRSGEPWLVGVSAVALDYVNSGFLTAAGMTLPAESWMLYSRYQRSLGLGGLDLGVDVWRKVEGAAEGGVELSRRWEMGAFAVLDVGLRASYLHSPHETWDGGHVPAGVDVSLGKMSFLRDRVRLEVSGEALGGRSFSHGRFSYQRFALGARTSLLPTPWATVKLNGYSGRLAGRGELPEGVLIDPQDMRTAAMRIDVRPHTRLAAAELDAATLELHFPVPFVRPSTDTMVLSSSKLRWYVFGDASRARLWERRKVEPLADAGWGLLLPFGGDVGGAGSIVVASLAAEVVFGKYFEGRWRWTPSLLFGGGRSW